MSKRSKDTSGQRRLFHIFDAGRDRLEPAHRPDQAVILTPAQRSKLVRINRLLTDLTDSHHPSCGCELCRARMLTDTQDRGSFTIPGVTLAVDAE
jgi:hypothetical protein